MHPATALAYCCFAVALAAAFVQPALCTIAFAGVASFGLVLDGPRAFARRMAWQAPVVAAIALLNCLFVQMGDTVIFQAGPFGVHAESLAYGLCMGLSLVVVMEVFVLLGELVSSDDALSLFGGRLPALALVVSTTLRLVPKMKEDAREIRDAMDACTAGSARAGAGVSSRMAPFRSASRVLSTLVSNAMEDSMTTADSMRARGWGSGARRTSYRRRGFSARDALPLTCVIAAGLLAFATGAGSASSFAFYPTVHGAASAASCAPYVLFFLLPHAAFAAESLRWRRGGVRE